MNTLQMRLGYLLLASLARGESGFDEDITLQQGEYYYYHFLCSKILAIFGLTQRDRHLRIL